MTPMRLCDLLMKRAISRKSRKQKGSVLESRQNFTAVDFVCNYCQNAEILRLTPYHLTKLGEYGIKATSKVGRAAFRLEREAFWKAEAKNNPAKYTAEDLSRMEKGRAPRGPDNHPMELHHKDRTPEGGIEPMSRTDHRLGENYKKNHPDPEPETLPKSK